MKTYKELIKLNSFEERFNYLKLDGSVGDLTFNGNRYLNQMLYKSPEWKRIRREVIIRDNGCDLGLEDYPIADTNKIIIHHISPITKEDILSRDPKVLSIDNLISCSFQTHNAIHYGNLPTVTMVERKPNDTIPWR